jgi:hypothetical protein
MSLENEPGHSARIRMLMVSDKDLTESVFRQLIEEPIIAADGRSLNGHPWGRVNFHPDGCAPERNPRDQRLMEDHWHVVWQRDDALRRSAVSYEYRQLFESPLADTLYDFCVRYYSPGS